jgi:predicted O-linked N-acetylglucosamine transferase (SPINDLY family)
MPTIPETFAIATGHHQAGRLQVAAQIYGQILAIEPNHVDACQLLGVIHAQTGNHKLAVEYISRALKANPNWAEALANLGNALKELGRLDEAVAALQHAVKLKPNFAGAHFSLGNHLRDQGNLDTASACFRRALALQPDFAQADFALGNVLSNQNHLSEAAACFRRVLKVKPDFVAAHYNLGNALICEGRFSEAVASFRQAVKLMPDFAAGHGNLGAALGELGMLDEALACYRRAVALCPDSAEAQNYLGIALSRNGKLDEAAGCYRRALELQPDFPAALVAAVHTKQLICSWDGLQVLAERVIEVVNRDSGSGIKSLVPPFSFLALPTRTTAEQHLRCARQWGDRQLKAIGGAESTLARHFAPYRKSKLTIGYLSADFRSHPVAALIAELIEKHDRDRFSAFGYSYGPDDGSPIRGRLTRAFDRFVELKDASFTESAQRIAADGVDVLVDLTGYTQDARTQILAQRPAPIQVNYLGYPGTLGAPFMDYILVDDFVVPDDQQPYFTEKLVHLPGCYMVNDSQREISAYTPSHAECGLPEQGFVFCSFNNSYKITPEMFDVWMDLLKAIPGSVLWLQEVNKFVPENLTREAAIRGVAADRLVFAPRTALFSEHLAQYRLADLFLDSFPYNAHATASDALWAGCPVLTLAGETFASRVAGSLLRALGLPELITTSPADYQTVALRLARNADLLAALRARLTASREATAVFSGEQFARTVEKAYLAMWEIYASGGQPLAFAVQ